MGSARPLLWAKNVVRGDFSREEGGKLYFLGALTQGTWEESRAGGDKGTKKKPMGDGKKFSSTSEQQGYAFGCDDPLKGNHPATKQQIRKRKASEALMPTSLLVFPRPSSGTGSNLPPYKLPGPKGQGIHPTSSNRSAYPAKRIHPHLLNTKETRMMKPKAPGRVGAEKQDLFISVAAAWGRSVRGRSIS